VGRIGKLRQRARLQRRTNQRDAEGGVKPAWTTYKSIWCKVIPKRGQEKLSEQRTTALVEHQVETRYFEGVHPSDRLLLRAPSGTDRVLSISAVLNKQERFARLVLDCTETIAPLPEASS